MRSMNFEGVDWNESGKKEKVVKVIETLLSLHSIRLVLLSVCAIAYLVITSAQPSNNAPDGKVIAAPVVAVVNDESKSARLTIGDKTGSISGTAAGTTREWQRRDAALNGTLASGLAHALGKKSAVIKEYKF